MTFRIAMPVRVDGQSYVIVSGDFVQTGGMDVANHALAQYLACAGRSVHLVAYRVAEELKAQSNVQTHSVPKPCGAYALAGPLLATCGFAIAARVARAGGKVVVNGGNCAFPAVNWVHYVHAAYRPTAAAGWRETKAQALHHVHVLAERLALGLARVVIANSERTRRDVIERVGIAQERVHTVYYGIDPVRFRPRSAEERNAARRSLNWLDERPRLTFLGAMGDRRKGFDVVYDAWRALCRRPWWDAQLVVVGAGAELASWRARAERDGLSPRIQFLGFRRDVPRILAASDALVSPARYEAYGLGVHEALCSALPALVSSEAGVAERYPASLASLLLDDPESAEALVEALIRWRDRIAAFQTLMLPFCEQLRARSWDDMARAIVSLCEERA